MTKTKQRTCFALAFLLNVSCSNRSTEPTPSGQTPGDIASRLIAGTVSTEEFQQLLALPERKQRAIVRAGAIQLGVQERVVDSLLATVPSDKKVTAGSQVLGACDQNVEWSSWGYGATRAYSYWVEQYCDGSDPDNDYVFGFNTTWRVDADRIRWYGTSWINFAFYVAYGGKLLSHGLCGYGKTLCLGTNGVTLAGGPGAVKLGLYLWYN